MKGLFITGTDTEIGKTYLTCALTRALRRSEIPALGLKPILAGERDDAEALQLACAGELSLDQINPLWLKQPLSPYAVGILENRKIDIAPVLNHLNRLAEEKPGPFLVEGVGGWLVPITRNYWLRDLAADLGLPLLIVASAGLGTLNHTLLTLESIRHSGGNPIGIILNTYGLENDQASETNPAILADLSGLPVYTMAANDPLDPLPPWLFSAVGS
jgi:dethiobiotin synthetase